MTTVRNSKPGHLYSHAPLRQHHTGGSPSCSQTMSPRAVLLGLCAAVLLCSPHAQAGPTPPSLEVVWNTTVVGSTEGMPYWRVRVEDDAALVAVQQGGTMNVTRLDMAAGKATGSAKGAGMPSTSQPAMEVSDGVLAMYNPSQHACLYSAASLQEIWCSLDACSERGQCDFALKGDTFVYAHGKAVTAVTAAGKQLWSQVLGGNVDSITVSIGTSLVAVSTGYSVSAFSLATGALSYSTAEAGSTERRFAFDSNDNLAACMPITSFSRSVLVLSPTGAVLLNYTADAGVTVASANLMPDSALLVTGIVMSGAAVGRKAGRGRPFNNYPERVLRVGSDGVVVWEWNTRETVGALHIMPAREQLAFVTTGSLVVLGAADGQQLGYSPASDYGEPGQPWDDAKGSLVFGSWQLVGNAMGVSVTAVKLP
eukprot:TRINITY_DN7409_c0_g2_i1.p1 TRINITY_DN7409_c0_g2~~TRINITY_DN7409_c0_g2_i1.p1  ORF type:complete len:425 (+),score=117.51 TRINITY_DN7409_c0_g2_i1:1226-2500(+)